MTNDCEDNDGELDTPDAALIQLSTKFPILYFYQIVKWDNKLVIFSFGSISDLYC